MAASIVDMRYATVMGTLEHVQALLEGLRQRQGAKIVDLRFANIVILAEPPNSDLQRVALSTTPQRQTTTRRA